MNTNSLHSLTFATSSTDCASPLAIRKLKAAICLSQYLEDTVRKKEKEKEKEKEDGDLKYTGGWL